ncbi:aminotransferase class I/II-fold pyridoxal phosphate-dependent enzyme [Rubricoccus marinus]|uniref:Aminotransferase class I/classII large domain-containing protein n=1 Tax=Rubricoccus marinus TaxID=716817 RepID=A0A259U0D5_9BACT|nr:aminotransferase class I/II-fold pyridoxal phosphate-dependent enzyme [Rubricoccus marinus]OZC03297.1 hypothetical protein BSZ36_10085 [Rubricoccus marinus]
MLHDPFDGLFDSEDPDASGLIAGATAERWMQTVGWGRRADLYTYSQPLAGPPGARADVGGREVVSASSYDYLGLASHPDVISAAADAVQRFGVGTGGVRLLTGTCDLHRELEATLAAHYSQGAALAFSSGYLANVAVLAALLGPDDVAVLDARCHRSIVDGCRLARVPVRLWRHNDVEHLDRVLSEAAPEARKTLVVTEGVFSMDGDLGPLAEIVETAERHGAYVMVDEAHALGAVGARGEGSWGALGVDPSRVHLWTGSLSKGLGASGGFVACGADVGAFLQHGAAPFFFSQALAPASTAAALASLGVMQREPERHAALRRNADLLREGVQAAGFDVGASASPIVPVVVGDDEAAYRLARDLWEHGVWATAVVFPAVARGAARLRLCATALHTPEDIDAICAALAACAPVPA